MDTQLIASLVDKISLGIMNAWDHETRVRNTVRVHRDGVYTDLFFQEYLSKEFNRAWRSRAPFSLMHLSWKYSGCSEPPAPSELAQLIARALRSADLVALGDGPRLWVLLPDIHVSTAQLVAQRICNLSHDHFHDALIVHIGLTQFSRNATAPSLLRCLARDALNQAAHSHTHSIVVKLVPILCKPGITSPS